MTTRFEDRGNRLSRQAEALPGGAPVPEHRVGAEFPALPEFVGVVRRLVSGVAVLAEGVDADQVDGLLIAVSEAFTNAVEAQNQAGVSESLLVECRFRDRTLEVSVEDAAGEGFAPGALPEPAPLSHADHLDIERGWGIALMRSLVSEVHFEATGRGTRVCLVVKCAGNRNPHPT
jgi:anti-sigma regulatory factor (Ser/Thr protein kinase)